MTSLRAGRIFAVLLIVPVWLACAAPAFPCVNKTMRDAAFEEPRDTHLLCVMARSDDPAGAAMLGDIQSWLDAADGLNVESRFADVNDPDLNWRDYGIPSAPPSNPVAVLAGRHAFENTAYFVDYWENRFTRADFEALAASPVRGRIRSALPKRLAALVYSPLDASSGETVRETVQRWNRDNPLGVEWIQLDRDDPDERVLRNFLGIGKDTPDWAALAFGKGKMMTPMMGESITAANLDEPLALLAGDCSCLVSPSSLGVDLPMPWTPVMDEEIVWLGPLLLEREIEAQQSAGSARLFAIAGASMGGIGLIALAAGFAIHRARAG